MPNYDVFNYDRMYQAYSGADMVAHINEVPVGTLQAVTMSITREVVPIYTMGDANAKTFVKGKRGIAGTLSFSTFDRHALLNDVCARMYGNTANDVGSWYSNESNRNLKSLIEKGQYYQNAGSDIASRPAGAAPSVNGAGEKSWVQDVINSFNKRLLKYSDEIPPFNITLTMVNDFGSASVCHVNGVVLINEGYGFTMDDLTNDMAFTYVAREVTPLQSLTSGIFTMHQ